MCAAPVACVHQFRTCSVQDFQPFPACWSCIRASRKPPIQGCPPLSLGWCLGVGELRRGECCSQRGGTWEGLVARGKAWSHMGLQCLQ